jgi:hypothetical protein
MTTLWEMAETIRAEEAAALAANTTLSHLLGPDRRESAKGLLKACRDDVRRTNRFVPARFSLPAIRWPAHRVGTLVGMGLTALRRYLPMR